MRSLRVTINVGLNPCSTSATYSIVMAEKAAATVTGGTLENGV
jgi:hypothetical protein